MIFLILPNIQAWFLAKCVLEVFMSDIQVHIIRLGQGQGGRSFANAAKGLRRKVWTRMKILSPNICYFVVTLRFVAIYVLSGRLWAKKVFFFWGGGCIKRCFLDNVHYYMVFITYYTELNLHICNYAQKQQICCGNSKYALNENFVAIFAFAERQQPSSSPWLGD